MRCVTNARRASRGVVMNSGVERRAERLGDARALVLLDDEGRRQDEDVAEARHRRRVAADDDAGVRAAPHDGAARVVGERRLGVSIRDELAANQSTAAAHLAHVPM